MSDAFLLVCGLATFAVAAALAVYAIAKLDARPMMAGVALAATAWIVAGCLSQTQEPYKRLGIQTLRLRPVDAFSGESVAAVTVEVIAPGDTGEPALWRLPTSPDDADPTLLTVSLFVQQEIHGSAWDQVWRAADCIHIDDQQMEISAPGYQPWRGSLDALLSERGPPVADEPPIVIKLRRRL